MAWSSMFFTDKKRKKNLIFSLFALTFFCGGVFLAQTHGVEAQSTTKAGAVLEGVGFTGGFFVNLLLYPLFVIVGWLASLAVSIFEWAIRPEDVALLLNNPGVYDSWKFVRDFFNLFFILVLLYIAFTVVFQIDKNFKKTILSLVLAALYINFSFPVSRFLIDATNVPMYFFANQSMGRNASQGTGIFGGVLSATNLERIILPGSNNGWGLGAFEAAYKNSVPRLIMAIVFMFIFSITLLVLSIMFVIRLVALVILVIFSSVGFAASIIPGMGQYSKMWWENFWKYAIFGPAAMLMLVIAERFFASIGGEKGDLMTSMRIVTEGTVTASDQTFFSSMALFTIPIIMLWMAMGLAQKMSIAGASSVVGLGQKVSKWVGKQATLTPLAFLGRKYEEKMTDEKRNKYAKYTKWLAPTAIYKGWEDWRKEQHEADKAPVERAAGGMQDRFNRVFGDHSNHAFRVRQQQANKKAKELLEISKNSAYLINELDHALHNGESELLEGATLALLQTNNLNDLMAASLGKSYGKGLDLETYTGEDGKERQAVVISSANYAKMTENLLSQIGLDPDSQEAAMEGMAMGENGLAAGNAALFGMYHYSDKAKKWKKSNEAEQAAMVDGKMRNLEPQVRQRTNHPDTTFKYYYNDKGERIILDLNDEVGVASLKSYKGGDVDNAGRSREDFRGGIYEIDKMRTDAEAGVEGVKMPELYLKALQQNEVLPKYVKKIRDGYESGVKEDKKASEPKPATGPQPGDTVSPGGIVIPSGSRTT